MFIILCLFIPFHAQAIMPGLLEMWGAGAASCYDCSGTASFIWEMNSTTVGDTGFSPCGCVSATGDDSATADNNVSIADGTMILDDVAANNGDDNYKFDNGADVLTDDTQGTVFIRLEVNTWVDSTRLFTIYGGADDLIYAKIASTDELAVHHQGSNDLTNLATTGSAMAGAERIVRIRWKTGEADIDLQLTVYNTAMAQQDDISVDGDLTAFTSQAGNTDFSIGNVSAVAGAKITFKYIHVYQEWRDADPNA